MKTTKVKKRSLKVTHSVRLPPDLSKKLYKLPYGGSSSVIEAALRAYWDMPVPPTKE